MGNRENEFPKGLRKALRKEAKGVCTICGKAGSLEVHHCVPISRNGTKEKHNALCVCPACHQVLDKLALQEGIYYPEVLMSPGVEYIISQSNRYRK